MQISRAISFADVRSADCVPAIRPLTPISFILNPCCNLGGKLYEPRASRPPTGLPMIGSGSQCGGFDTERGAITQAVVLVIFVLITLIAVIKFRPRKAMLV